MLYKKPRRRKSLRSEVALYNAIGRELKREAEVSMKSTKGVSMKGQDLGGGIITWDRPKLERLKKVYLEAVKHKTNDDVFLFEGREIVISYARYLIMYLDSKLEKGV